MTTWALRMAIRDSRGSRSRLLLFLLSMSIGVAALVAIDGFAVNLRETVADQARGLLGADLGIESDIPFDASAEAIIDSIASIDPAATELARRTTFTSMAYFPRIDATRIVSVRATSGGFPFYGAFEVDPPAAAAEYQSDRGALIDGALAAQFAVGVGDTVRVGTKSYPIRGVVGQTTSEPAFVSLVSPRVFIPLADVDTTLLSFGSRVDYEVFFRFDGARGEAGAIRQLADELEAHFDAHGDANANADVDIDTVEDEQRGWGEALGNIYGFLSLIAFTALLLGGIGVASAIHVHIQQRKTTVALLRCIGATPRNAGGVYLVQAALLGLVGALVGALAGVMLQYAVPGLLADALPVQLDMSIRWRSVLLGVAAGLGITLLFAGLPLLGIRHVSPLEALRSGFESDDDATPTRRRGYRVAAIVAIAGCVAAGALLGPSPAIGAGYVVGIGAVLGVLAGTAWLVIAGIRRWMPRSLPYVARQGLANLHRPHNQTLLVLLSVGFGAFLVFTLLVVRSTLLAQVSMADGDDLPNLIFFDIQDDQLAGIRNQVSELGLPLVEEAPIVNMRLTPRGEDAEEGEVGEDGGHGEKGWAHNHEYRSTYRGALSDTEELIEGDFVARYGGQGAVPISLEEGIAEDLDSGVGDTLLFDVQGRMIETVVSGIRRVDWNRMQTNFFVVFPEGVLEAAPKTWVVVSRAGDAAQSGQAQSAVVRDYPNVSAIDLTLIIGVVTELFSRLAAVIQFMALFSIATGLLILGGTVAVSRFRRADEMVLLKALGASRADVWRITAVEYLALGGLSALVALVLALAAAWQLARHVFETALVVPGLWMTVAVVSVVVLTAAIGIANSRGVYRASAMDVLRRASEA